MIPTKEQNQLNRLNEDLEKLFMRLDNYSHEQLNKQPDAATWSPLMVAKHVMLAESGSANYVRKKLSFNPKVAKAGISAKLRVLILDFFFKSPLKRKAPTTIGDAVVKGTYQLEAIKLQWREERVALQQLLTELPIERYEEEVYKHPFIGRLSISGMLQFFQGHFDRHRKQMEERLQ